jgi:hypothetical protein
MVNAVYVFTGLNGIIRADFQTLAAIPAKAFNKTYLRLFRDTLGIGAPPA